jgi:hypothetical protein
MCSEVFFAQLKQNLFVGLVRTDRPLEGQDQIGVICEDIVAKGGQFFEVVD